jgi:hypothetical protein
MGLKKLLAELDQYENPFDIQGTDDPHQNQEQKPIVDVGLVSRASKELVVLDVNKNSQVRHALLIAPYGGGKSATLRKIYHETYLMQRPVAYEKLESGKFKEVFQESTDIGRKYVSKLFTEVSIEIIKRVVKFEGKTGKEFETAFKSESEKFLQEKAKRSLPNVFMELGEWVIKKGFAPGVVLIDEVEALLTTDEISDAVKLNILDYFKNWSETTRKGLSLILAGTQACLDFISQRAPKLIGGRFTIFDQYALDIDEVADYIKKKCRAATKNHSNSGELFNEEAVELVARASHGIPRRIEIICSGAWQIATVSQSKVDRTVIREQLYSSGEGVLNNLMNDYKLTRLQKTALRKLLKYGMNTIYAREALLYSEKGAIRRIAEKEFDIPMITKHGRGEYEFSDEILIEMFDKHH